MKNNLLTFCCLGILTCCGSVPEKNSDTIQSPVTNNQQLTTSIDVDENVNTDNSKETSPVSSDPENGKEVQLNAGNVNPETRQDAENKIVQSEEDLAVAANKVTETGKAPTETIKTTRPETKPAEDENTSPSEEESVLVVISVVPDRMKFDKEAFTVKAGQKVVIELDNPDGMQHNLVIGKPGTLEIVGAAADALARDPKGAEKNYVPEIPEVLHATKLLNPDEITTITFTAPSEPGDYPFICTFPGHWRMMNGIMKVTR